MTTAQKLWLGLGPLIALLMIVCSLIFVHLRTLESNLSRQSQTDHSLLQLENFLNNRVQAEAMESFQETNSQILRNIIALNLTLLLAGALIGITFGIWTSRSIQNLENSLQKNQRMLAKTAFDAGPQKSVKDQIPNIKKRFRAMMEASPLITWSSSPKGNFLTCNQHWFEYTGLTRDQSRGKGWIEAVHSDHRQETLDFWKETTQHGIPFETEVLLRQGSSDNYRWHLVRGRPIKNEAGAITRWVGFAVDIHYHREARQMDGFRHQLEYASSQLEKMTTTDDLTHLQNHRAFMKDMAREVQAANRHGTPLSLLLLDLDQFRAFNDTFGAPAGDAALQTVARLLKGTARGTDFVARFSGEKFALLLPGTDQEGAKVFAERVRTVVEEGPWVKRALTASVGASTLSRTHKGNTDKTGFNAEELINAADAALFQCKKNGRNCVRIAEGIIGRVPHWNQG